MGKIREICIGLEKLQGQNIYWLAIYVIIANLEGKAYSFIKNY